MARSKSHVDGLKSAIDRVVRTQKTSKKPLAIILAGHNGSGKSTMWYSRLAPVFKIPLVNADRLMMSILPEPHATTKKLPEWAQELRDGDEQWMLVAQQGVQAFVAQAMSRKVPFAMETVFSHWKQLPDGIVESKIDNIRDMQKAGYFVLLIFVGLARKELSLFRVQSRVELGGHAISQDKLFERFPRTQKAINAALSVTDAAILADNSDVKTKAFTLCRVQIGTKLEYDCRTSLAKVPATTLEWLDIVAPL